MKRTMCFLFVLVLCMRLMSAAVQAASEEISAEEEELVAEPGKMEVAEEVAEQATLEELPDEENEYTETSYGGFVAKAGKTYYIAAKGLDDAEQTFTLTQESDLSGFEAVTGNVESVGNQFKISDTSFTKPETTDYYCAEIICGLSEQQLLDGIVINSFYLTSGTERWEEELKYEYIVVDDSAAYNLFVPGVTYYYCAAILNTQTEEVIVSGEIKSFVAPERDFEAIGIDQTVSPSVSPWWYYTGHYNYSFTAPSDGTYMLCVDGFGDVRVCDFTGEEIILEYSNSINEGNITKSFIAEVGEVYYIRVVTWAYANICVIRASEGHEWDEGVVTKAPTCTEEGEMAYTCIQCGETKVEEMDALGHQWDEGKITTWPMCSEDGVRTFTCTRCDDEKTESVPALGGDLDGDGQFTEEDLNILMAHLAGGGDLSAEEADLNGDGLVDVLDIVRLMRYLAGERIDTGAAG